VATLNDPALHDPALHPTRLPAGEKRMWFLRVWGTPNSGRVDKLAEAHAATEAAYDRRRQPAGV